MDPTQLSRELREARTPDLHRRRWIIGLSLLGAAMGQIVTLYQTGIIRRLPDPPLRIFDSSRVDASDYGYKRLNTPDAVMMVVSYGATAWLAAAGGKDRASNLPLLPVMMGLKILGDAATAVELGREEWRENKALCAYCQVATIASLASLPLAFPEMRRALANLLGRRN
ncbi:vitamin K epoxide reductase family protein [Deinococcus apachensis]|uniref:vitamin K epoxide reductase family protein n=1 Tax=Deinococcus apachensis TaxID=309886 RepID=UPI00037B0602|nr:vitamin K epoxide reductase family protein [Deinococcus apachensis]